MMTRNPKRQQVAPEMTTLPSGTPVIVRKDDGSEVMTKTRSLPWQLGHGDWVVSLDCFVGGYDLARVRRA